MPSYPAAPSGGRATLLLIVGIPLTMILAASWLWYVVAKGDVDLLGALGTANNGTLVTPPRSLQSLTFVDAADTVFHWDDVEPRWTLVVPAPGQTCDTACERQIWLTRQIHVALGKDFNRVRRVLVTNTPLANLLLSARQPTPEGWPEGFESGSVLEYLALGHPGIIALRAEQQGFASLFTETVAEGGAQGRGGWYLADPAGWVMMRYEDGLDYKAVMSDLKFLLKNSGGG